MRNMTAINHFDLRAFDLNLLIAFDALMRDRSVTRAATRLKVGQPAMSHSLSVLRTLFQDELFIRVGTRMQPTARATAIAPAIEAALLSLQQTIYAPAAFDPATDQRLFRIGVSKEVETLVMPTLAAHLNSEAPQIRVHSRIVLRKDITRQLDEQAIDFAIGCFDPPAQRYHRHMLYAQSLSCVFNPDQLSLSTPLSLKNYLQQPHALVTMSEDLQGCLSEALDRVGHRLNVAIASADFLSVLDTVATAPLIGTLPTRIARRYSPRFGLIEQPIPLTLGMPDVSLLWTTAQDQAPATHWLRALIARITAQSEH